MKWPDSLWNLNLVRELLSDALGDEGEEWYVEWFDEPFEGWDGIWRWSDPNRSDDCFNITHEGYDTLKMILAP